MKDKTARILAIIALVFIGICSVAIVMTIIDHRMLGGSIGFIALGSGVFGLVIFFALKADGRGYSITKMNNDIEMKKIEDALKEQEEKEAAEKSKEATHSEPDDADVQARSDGEENN